MTTRCGACLHRQSGAIDAAIRAGEPATRIARAYGLSRYVVGRHRDAHLGPVAMVSPTSASFVDPDTSVEALDRRLVALQSILTDAVDQAVRTGKTSALLGASRELRATIESVARLRGQLNERPTVNLLALPAWQHVSSRLLAALTDFPEARAAAARALTEGVEQ